MWPKKFDAPASYEKIFLIINYSSYLLFNHSNLSQPKNIIITGVSRPTLRLFFIISHRLTLIIIAKSQYKMGHFNVFQKHEVLKMLGFCKECPVEKLFLNGLVLPLLSLLQQSTFRIKLLSLKVKIIWRVFVYFLCGYFRLDIFD
jgi:hypothetical protein